MIDKPGAGSGSLLHHTPPHPPTINHILYWGPVNGAQGAFQSTDARQCLLLTCHRPVSASLPRTLAPPGWQTYPQLLSCPSTRKPMPSEIEITYEGDLHAGPGAPAATTP